ncbi:TIGR04211 family SH3 domain-containing protein [Teredinibacter waterburyi]|uniref:TIGR04211 family SH3 domain-containing protein n=1 Tax=Teredinibacter waterburyi TaxID=1500538 RepID=UPI001FE5FC75|nr:TIGR04211 family SH3 domain-containing protein [Teredinibacter waterburyi]
MKTRLFFTSPRKPAISMAGRADRQWLTAIASTLLFFGSLAPASIVTAEELRYITDVLFVPIRSGQGNEYRIINSSLKSGTKIYYLGPGDTDEWVKVRTEAGEEGWMRSQYVSKEEPAKLQLTKAQTQVAKLTQINAQLKTSNAKLANENQQLNSNAQTASSSESAMATELQKIKTLSAGAIELERRYTELLEAHQMLQTEKDVLTAENEQLKNDSSRDSMLYGAGLLILGMLLTIILPIITPRKRQSDWR